MEKLCQNLNKAKRKNGEWKTALFAALQLSSNGLRAAVAV